MLDDSWGLPNIIAEGCTLCGQCVQVCERGALVLGETKPLLAHPEDCDGCGECEDVCPQGGIECAFEIVLADE